MKKNLPLLLLLILLMLALSACFSQDAASIGIIGGADGPTSIYLAGKSDAQSGDLRSLAIILLLVLFVCVVLFRIRKTKPKDRQQPPDKKPPGTL